MHSTGKKGIFIAAFVAAGAIWGVSLALFTSLAQAYVSVLPVSIAQEALSETVPTAVSVFDLTEDDYVFDWAGQPPPTDVQISLVPHTIQWVRVSEVLVLPRARMSVRVRAAQMGRVSNAGFAQAFSSPDSAGELRLEMPVALLSGESNAVDIGYQSGGKMVNARAVLRFKPRLSLGSARVFYDTSCSRFGVRAEGSAQSTQAQGWAYVGCRVAEVQGAEHRTSSLEVFVFWDNIGQSLLVGGMPTAPGPPSVWSFRLRTDPGNIQLAVPRGANGGGDEMLLRYATPENFHRGFLGGGLGPYWDRFSGKGETSSTPAPVVTLYGSYFLTESLRLVTFNATTLDSHWTSDGGVYLNTEYLRLLDRRLVINLLLGGHATGFSTAGQYYVRFGVPQGVEINYLDFFKRGYNLNTGFFIYPLINGTSYYNVWLRWGTARLFCEFNYISWDQTVNDQALHSDSVGISLGMPLLRFL